MFFFLDVFSGLPVGFADQPENCFFCVVLWMFIVVLWIFTVFPNSCPTFFHYVVPFSQAMASLWRFIIQALLLLHVPDGVGGEGVG